MAVKIAVITFLFTCIVCVLGNFNLTVVHISDFHSHWFEFDENKHDCSKEESKAGKCYGGFARLLTFVRDIRKKEKNVLVLSSGDFFLGKSLYALHGWKMAHSLLPKLELDAMSLSNHDFDTGVFPVSVFLYAMKFPVLCANMVARNTSFLYSRVNKSVVLDINGTKVGIVGYIHRHAQMKTKRAVSYNFVPEIPALQEEVSRLENEGVNKIIALGHAGYHTDLEIAKNVKGVDIVMGGDSDIMLFDPGHDADELSKVGNIHGNYPRIHHQEPESVNDPSLVNRTLVLHIPQHGMYVGVLRATFDDNGKIIHESGEPVLLDSSIAQDKATLEFMEWAKGALEELNEHGRIPDDAEILGIAKGHLDGNRRRCRMEECSLGNFIADAMLHEFTFHYRNKSEHRYESERWGPIDAVVYNSGTILRSIEPGYIKIKDLIKSIFLGGFVRRAYMSGQQVLDMMEHSVKHYDPSGVTAPGSFLQIGGMKVEYDLSQPPGRRVRSLTIRCRDCGDDNMYHSIVSYKTYIIGMPLFIHNGRDGFYDFEERVPKDMGQFDVALLIEHLKRVYEVMPKIDGRIKFFQSKSMSNSSFSPPLLFGEPASEYNKIDGVFAVTLDKQTSETDKKEEENSLNVIDEIAEMKNDKEYEKKSSSAIKQQPERNNSSSFVSETSGKKLKLSEEETKIEKDDSMQELPKYTIMDLKTNREALETRKINDLFHHDSNRHETKNNEPAKKDYLNQAYLYLSDISSNLFGDSKKITETSDDSSEQETQNFKNVGGGINKISKSNENVAIHLSKENSQSSKPETIKTIKNETRIHNMPKVSELLKVLINRSSEIASSSYGNISKKFLDLPGSSEFLEKVSRNLTKRSIKDWLDDNGNIMNYLEFKNNISSFLENLEQCLRSNLSAISSDPVSNEKQGNSTENSKISELMKALFNTSSSFVNISQKHLDLLVHSYFFENYSHNLLDGTENIKYNVSSFLETLDKCLRSNLSLNRSESTTNEIQRNSTESTLEKTFVEIVKHILRDGILNHHRLKNQIGIKETTNIAASNATDLG